jgi:hypothetical protein
MSTIEKFIDSRNQNLYFEVLEKTSIKLIENNKWGSATTNEIAMIYFSKSNSPFACFTHELLHVKYYHLGLIFPKHTAGFFFDEYIISIFNQLCHHKFFDEFCSLGFRPKNFLDESLEIVAITQIEEKIDHLEIEFSLNGELKDLFDLLSVYLMLKSPHDKSVKILRYINRLKAMREEIFFSTIDLILDDWKKETKFDSSLTLAKIFKACNYPEIGFYISNVDEIIYSKDIKNCF